jgi:hypothetical protein
VHQTLIPFKWTCWVTLVTHPIPLNPCLDSNDQEEEALSANVNQEDIYYEEPDLSGGVEGEDYKIVYSAEEEAEQ